MVEPEVGSHPTRSGLESIVSLFYGGSVWESNPPAMHHTAHMALKAREDTSSPSTPSNYVGLSSVSCKEGIKLQRKNTYLHDSFSNQQFTVYVGFTQ